MCHKCPRGYRGSNAASSTRRRTAVLKDLFTTDVGLMTVIGLTFMLGMGAFFIRYFLKHMREDGEAAARQLKR
ncbi:MAG: DUF3149 domain-containing protein [Betaproteobacteria bacterium]|nr:DUF3149 domain-containing protein [Betaproteobacteria bacterium]